MRNQKNVSVPETLDSLIHSFVQDVERCLCASMEAKLLKERLNGEVQTHDVNDELTKLRLRNSLNAVLPLIKTKRMWFAVAKGLMLKGYVAQKDFRGAISLIEQIRPETAELHLNPKEVSRNHVLSFTKHPYYWDEKDAPVHGTTFYLYVEIAMKFMENI